MIKQIKIISTSIITFYKENILQIANNEIFIRPSISDLMPSDKKILLGYYINDQLIGILSLRKLIPKELMSFLKYYENYKIGHLDFIVVHKNFRRHLIAKELLLYLIKTLKSLNYNKISSTISPKNIASLNLHISTGFKPSYYINDYFGETRILFLKSL